MGNRLSKEDFWKSMGFPMMKCDILGKSLVIVPIRKGVIKEMHYIDTRTTIVLLLFCFFLGACTTKQPIIDHPAVEHIEFTEKIHFFKGVFHPEGNLLAVSGWIDNNPRSVRIYIVDLTTKELSVVSPDNWQNDPGWTADGLLSYSAEGSIFITDRKSVV